MLKKIEIKRFRSCKDISISDLPSLVTLIGRNAAGKTNVLRAIEWVARVASGDMIEQLLSPYFVPFDQGPQISVVIEIRKKIYTYELTLFFNRSEPRRGFLLELEESVSVQENGAVAQEICRRKGGEIRTSDSNVKVGLLAPCLPSLASLFPAATAIVKQTRPLLDFFKRVRYYPLDEPSDATNRAQDANVVQDDEYKKWLAQYKQNESPGPSILMRLIYMESQGRLKDLENILGDRGLKLIDRIIVQKHSWPTSGEGDQPKSQVIHRVSFVVSDSNPKHPGSLSYSHLSCGTRKILRLILSLLFDHDSIMLIEHPEDGVHTGLVKKVMDHMRLNAGPTQIIMSSHSLTLLNGLAPEEVRLITINKGATYVRALTQKELQIANNFISEQGGNLADFVETVGD